MQELLLFFVFSHKIRQQHTSMRKRLTGILLFTAVLAIAQTNPVKRTCGTEAPGKAWDEWFNSKVEEFRKNDAAYKGESTNYTIPVVFHVIYGTESVGSFPNLSQAQINSQINVLNDDFAGTGFN